MSANCPNSGVFNQDANCAIATIGRDLKNSRALIKEQAKAPTSIVEFNENCGGGLPQTRTTLIARHQCRTAGAQVSRS